MITEDKVIEIVYMADEYSKEFSKVKHKYSLGEGRQATQEQAESHERCGDNGHTHPVPYRGFRYFKHFYLGYVCRHMRHLFPRVVSYSRFVDLEKEVAVCLCLFIKDVLLGKCTGVSLTYSTALRVYHIKCMHSQRTFSSLAQIGRTGSTASSRTWSSTTASH